MPLPPNLLYGRSIELYHASLASPNNRTLLHKSIPIAMLEYFCAFFKKTRVLIQNHYTVNHGLSNAYSVIVQCMFAACASGNCMAVLKDLSFLNLLRVQEGAEYLGIGYLLSSIKPYIDNLKEHIDGTQMASIKTSYPQNSSQRRIAVEGTAMAYINTFAQNDVKKRTSIENYARKEKNFCGNLNWEIKNRWKQNPNHVPQIRMSASSNKSGQHSASGRNNDTTPQPSATAPPTLSPTTIVLQPPIMFPNGQFSSGNNQVFETIEEISMPSPGVFRRRLTSRTSTAG